MESTDINQSGYWPIRYGVFGNSYRGFDSRVTLFFILFRNRKCQVCIFFSL